MKKDDTYNDIIILPDLTKSGNQRKAKVRNHTHNLDSIVKQQNPKFLKKIKIGNWVYHSLATVGIIATALLPGKCDGTSTTNKYSQRENVAIEAPVEVAQTEEHAKPTIDDIQDIQNSPVIVTSEEYTPHEPVIQTIQEEREEITTIIDYFMRYPTGNGPIDAKLLYYDHETLRQGILHDVSVEDLQRLTQYFEETATFYKNAKPVLEEVIERTRGISIPMSQGDLRVFNIKYRGDADSDNLELDFSEETRDVHDREGTSTRSITDLVDKYGKTLGVEVTADQTENVEEMKYNIPSQQYTNTTFEETLVEAQENGYTNYIIFPREGDGIIASVPKALDHIAVEYLSTLFGLDDQLTIDYTRSAPQGNPRSNPENPEIPKTHDGYRFDPLADNGPGDYGGPGDTMHTMPRDNPMDDHNTGGTGDRPYRPRN